MSANLKPGDLCEIVASPCSPTAVHLVGMQCTIDSVYEPKSQLEAIFGPDPNVQHFWITLSTGKRGVVCHHVLRKKEPPADVDVLGTGTPYSRGSWLDLERLTGWTPTDRGVTHA